MDSQPPSRMTLSSTSTSVSSLSTSTDALTPTPTASPKVTYCSRFVSTWDDDDFDFGIGTQTPKLPPPLEPLKLEPNLENLAQNLVTEEDDEKEVEATDNLLGRLRMGMNIIETHARETMAGCSSDESRLDMEQRLEKSTLRMLKAEKSFMNTARIIAEVVDEYASEYEHEPIAAEKETEKVLDGDEVDKQIETMASSVLDDKEEGEDEEMQVLFRHDMMSSASIGGFREKVNKIFGERLTTFQNGLTDTILKGEKKFKDLQRQIGYGRRDAERLSNGLFAMDTYPGGEGDCEEEHRSPNNDIDNRSSEEEEEDYDDSILPCIDPINKQPIYTAVTNKFCHHVFDKSSITKLIHENPQAKCPVYGCRNKVALKMEDLVFEERLTEQIRAKNDKLYGAGYFNVRC